VYPFLTGSIYRLTATYIHPAVTQSATTAVLRYLIILL